jgi:hypothetical protein
MNHLFIIVPSVKTAFRNFNFLCGVDNMASQKEQLFFNDPAMDKMMGMIMALAAEVYILRDRNRALEDRLVSAGLMQAGALDEYKPDPERSKQVGAERDAFIARIMQPLFEG